MKLIKTLVLCGALAAVVPVQAALPVAVQGQALPSLAPMLEKTAPGVVNISTKSRRRVARNPLLDDPFFRRFFDVPEQPREEVTQSLGSGVIVDARLGYIITNNHVIESADEILVTLRDGRELPASLIGRDPQADVALIRVKADKLSAVPWGDSDALRVGDFVVAIGNPFGLGQTVTSGIVSALGRSGLGIEDYEDFIQTDASINPGNSGGALVDLEGRLVGINTAIVGPSGGNVGIGFAIPAEMVQRIKDHLIRYGEVRRGRLGINGQDLSPELADAFGLDEKQHGVVIIDVTPDSPAHKAGLKRGDVLVSVGGRRVRNAESIRNIMGLMLVGEEVEMEIIRAGKSHRFKATVAANQDRRRGRSLHPLLEGGVFANAQTPMGRPYIEVADVRRNSKLAAYGLREGDIILSVNRQSTGTLAEMENALRQDKDAVLLSVQRGRSASYVLIQ
ncbi:DegQ family serine endoprotease [Granulosicoccaceae sp. 1_MG-2023]|nr:DegQ family serine endoprotease [Granulosicoccaceae sp. 1_MG-2023]